MLRTNLCDYSDVYIVVNGTIDLLAANQNDKGQKDVALKTTLHLGQTYHKIVFHALSACDYYFVQMG